jgi:trans-aconitate methyltransferase
MVSLAKSQYHTPSAAGPNFIQMDAAELGFREVFQVVLSNAVLHWVHDHRAVLAGIYRSLVPGGCCLLQMGGKGNASQMIAVLDQIRGRPQWRDFFSEFRFPYRFYSDEEYRPLLQAAGLTISRVELVHKDMQHHGKDKLAGWLRTAWLPYVQQVPAGSRESFIAEVAAAYRRNYPPVSEGIVHVPMVRLEVEAFRE